MTKKTHQVVSVNPYASQVKVYPYDDGGFVSITGYVAEKKWLSADRAEINWPSIGAVSIEHARQFARAILHACNLTEREAIKRGILPKKEKR